MPSPMRKKREGTLLEKLENRINNMEKQTRRNTEILERLDKVSNCYQCIG